MGIMSRLSVLRTEEAAGMGKRLGRQYDGEPKHRKNAAWCPCTACHQQRQEKLQKTGIKP